MSFYIEKRILDVAPRTRLGVVELDGCQVGFGHASMDEMRLKVVNRVRDEVRTTANLKTVPQIAGFDQLRSYFDSEMRRSSSTAELLLRRVLEGRNLPVENDAVDAGVLLGLFYKLPVVLIDPTSLRGDVGLVIGNPSREFEVQQGHDPIHTGGRMFFADDLTYFASPVALGKRAVVTERSRRILTMAVFPENVGDSIVRDFIRRAGNWLESLCGGSVTQEGMVGVAEAAE
ncbi:MAG: hypothetical protein KDB53_08550 [Planctomycetes bacterium]|nr:hypothetical protein [Planctomycetota bacterium]